MSEETISAPAVVDNFECVSKLPLKLTEHAYLSNDNFQSPTSPTSIPTMLPNDISLNNSLDTMLDRQLLKCSSMASTCGSPVLLSAKFNPEGLDKLNAFDKLYSSFSGCTIKSFNDQSEFTENKVGKVSKLVKLSERINGFERQIQMQAKRKILAEETKIKYLDQTIARLAQSVDDETNHRLETVKALHSIFETQIKVVEQKIESMLSTKFTHLQQVLNTLNDKMSNLEVQIENEKVILSKNVKDKSQIIAGGVSSLNALVEEERIKRSQRETKILQIATSAESKVEKLLDSEKRSTENKLDELRNKFETWKVTREKEACEFQNLLLKELSNIKNGLVLECQARESADDDIVQALHSYAKIFACFDKETVQ